MDLKFYKKILIGFVLIGLVYNPVFFIPKANAAEILGIGAEAEEIIAALEVDTTAITGAITGVATAQHSEKIIDTIKKITGQLLKKLIIDRIVDAAVQWIEKGGFEGNGGPFIEDWSAFFQQAGEDFVGELANKYVPMLCGPFQANVAFSLLQPKKFSTQVECSLNNIVDNVDNFFKDFNAESKGRWLTYNAIWQPQNNFYGSALAVEDQRQMGLADVLNQKNVEATVNIGFKPQVSCKKDAETGKEVCKTVTPGQIIGRSVEQAALPNFKSNAILSADDIAEYIGALLDAVFYRYSLLAVGGAKAALSHVDSENKTTTYADFTKNTFGAINKVSFQNNKALYLDEISSALTTKRSTLNTLNEASSTQQDLINKLKPVAVCSVSGLSAGQSQKIIEAKNKIDEINASIADIGIRKDQLQYEIIDLQSAYDDLNSLSNSQTDEAQLFIVYNSLKDNGKLDSKKANQTLSDAQIELINIKQDATIALGNTSDAVPSGYKDLINLCK